LFNVLVGRRGIAKRRVRGGRYAVALHETLGEFLGALEPRGGLRRAENPQARRPERVHDTLGERRLRTDDGEDNGFLLREFDQFGYRGQRDIGEPVLARGAGVAGRDVYPRDARRARELPRQRMLPSTRADDQQLHQCLKWRKPVNTIAIPCSSAAAITSSSRWLPPGWMMA